MKVQTTFHPLPHVGEIEAVRPLLTSGSSSNGAAVAAARDESALSPLRLRGGGDSDPSRSTSGAAGTSAGKTQRISQLQQEISHVESQLQQLSVQQDHQSAQFNRDFDRLKANYAYQPIEQSNQQWAAMTSASRELGDRRGELGRQLVRLRSELDQIQRLT